MSIASVVTRGYGQGVKYIPTRGYLPAASTADTHDGLPKKHHKINLPIYEFTKRKTEFGLDDPEFGQRIEEIQSLEGESQKPSEKSPQLIPVKWDNSAIEAYAAKAALTFAEAERRVLALQKMQEDEDEEFSLMVMAATLH